MTIPSDGSLDPHSTSPHSFLVPGRQQTGRPTPLLLGAIAVGALSLLFMISAIVPVLGVELWIGDFGVTSGTSTVVLVGVVFNLFAALVAAVSCVLTLSGKSLGSALALGVAGAAVWDAADWWQTVFTSLIDGGGLTYLPWIRMSVSFIGGFIGIAVVFALGASSISAHLAGETKKSAGVPLAGPSPHDLYPPRG